jgi:hypothetical protein
MAHTMIGLYAGRGCRGSSATHGCRRCRSSRRRLVCWRGAATGDRRSGTVLVWRTLSQRLIPPQRVVQLERGQDPRPLYFIPWIPGGTDFDHDVLREKIRSHIVSWIGRTRAGHKVELAFDDLLNQLTRNQFSLWRNRPSLRGEVYPAVAAALRDFCRGVSALSVSKDKLSADFDNEGDKDAAVAHVLNASPIQLSFTTFQPELPLQSPDQALSDT